MRRMSIDVSSGITGNGSSMGEGNSLRIGLAGPARIDLLRPLLNDSQQQIPKGLGSRYVPELAIGLREAGHSVSVYTLDEETTAPSVFRGDRLTVCVGPYRRRHRMRDLMKVERNAITDFIMADKPDVVGAQWTYEFALGTLEAGVPASVTVHDWAPTILRYDPTPYRAGRLVMSMSTLRRAKWLVANSEYIRAKLKGRADVSLIPNFLPDEIFNPTVLTREPEQHEILSVNNGFGTVKNVETLLEAFRLVRSEMGDVTLVLIGEGYEPGGEAEAWAQRRGLNGGIRFEGSKSQEEVHRAMRRATLLVHPSYEESFGFTILETMVAGTPVIGGEQSGAVPWLLDGGRCGLLVDVSQPHAIAGGILSMLRSREKQKAFSEAGYRRAEDFKRSRAVTLYEDLFKKVLGCRETRGEEQ